MKQFFGFCTIVSIFFGLALSSCSISSEQSASDTTYLITIKLKALDTGTLILNYASNGEAMNDTARSTTGVYTFSGKCPEPRRAWLRIEGDHKNPSLIFFMENGRIDIRAQRDSLSEGQVTGTKTNEENLALEKMLEGPQRRMKILFKLFEETPNLSQAKEDSLMKIYNVIEQDRKDVIADFIRANPRSYAGPYYILDEYGYNPDVPQFEQTFNLLDSTLKLTPIGKQVAELLQVAKLTDVNQVAPDFTLNDVDGKPVALSSFRGKYVLLDFWASWCGPCREENPNLVQAYKAYHKLGFEIVGVSFDYPGERDNWLKAISKDNLTWTHLSDLQGFNSSAGKLYGINAIPMNYLLDPEGRIVAKGLRGGDLEQKLASLLKGS